ncbi:MAG: sigma-70 family RNA polymerase sigma factor [Fimbriimonadales bacterium]
MYLWSDYPCVDDLVVRAQQGDEDASEQVIALFRPLAQSVAGRFFLPCCDAEDVYQIALLGLWRAVQCFDPQRQTSFVAFARVCIRRQILSELKRAQRWNLPTFSLSDTPENQHSWLERIADPSQDLLEQLCEHEALTQRQAFLDTRLSPLEAQVIALYQQKLTYRQIAERLGCSLKAVDNALTRVKRKARRG